MASNLLRVQRVPRSGAFKRAIFHAFVRHFELPEFLLSHSIFGLRHISVQFPISHLVFQGMMDLRR
ncbi:hypothetical protein QWZ13_11710 [Reinekea marina]|uniref:hypothetical protein n=1 Tax=Reinekea marina TaxID=1310421 RepID=UPI0025B56BD2|nr:hypothetical protein [Reinekea marina]MDN3649582.1 hypothetical protein [Reinekea marina]